MPLGYEKEGVSSRARRTDRCHDSRLFSGIFLRFLEANTDVEAGREASESAKEKELDQQEKAMPCVVHVELRLCVSLEA